jgi:iron complex outermembrane receptor protein
VKRLTGRRGLLCSVAVLVLGTASEGFAQQPPASGDKGPEEIVVTGSRIVRRDFTSQSPIVTIDQSTFTARTNVGMEAALNQFPQFTPGGTQAQNSPAGTPFPQADAAPGAATLNLRGLGGNRSLVLVDGRRVQPVNGQLLVDINTIPSAAISRVEVITGGAAAVYGADAIAGVVNFITKKDFSGVEVNAQSSITGEGDGEETSISGILGASLDDGRGSVMLGADWSKRNVIFGRDRGWVVDGWNDPGTTSGGIGSSNLSQFDPARASYCAVTNCGQPLGAPFGPGNAPAGGFPLTGGTIYGIDQNGNLFDPNNPLNATHPYTGPLGGNSGFKLNPVQTPGTPQTLGQFDPEHTYLQLPLERYAIFGSGRMALTEKVEVFAELHYSETFATASGFVSSLFNVWSPTVPYNHLYDDPNSPQFNGGPAGTSHHPVPAALAALLNSRPTQDAPWTYVGGLDYIPNFTTETTSNVYQAIGGVKGDVGVGKHDWTWELYASHGSTTVNARQPEGFPYLPRLQNLFNADYYGKGFDVLSLPGAVPLAVTGHCTSGIPLFTNTGAVDNTPSVSQDCADYMVLRMNDISHLTQDIIEGSVTGAIAEMKSGQLQFALGMDARREHFSYDPDTGYNANQDYPYVIQNIILPVSVDGETTVKEIYGELAIPLLNDRVELDPGVRYSDYDTVGKTTTYKLMGDWKIVDRVRFRGGYQFATRAPNVNELFTPRGGSALLGGTDACANYPQTQVWGNVATNPNRLNLQALCQQLMVRDGAPATLYVPGQASADNYNYNVFGGQFFFPFVIGVTEGNRGLESETADTYTAGFVFDLPGAERLTLSIDWFLIELEKAVGIPGHDTVYQQCLDGQYNPLIGSAPGSHSGVELAAGNPFCALIQREYVGGAPLTPGNYGADRKFSAQYINQGGITSEGADIQVDWGIGSFLVNVQGSIQTKYEVAPFPGAAFIDYTGTINATANGSAFDYRLLSSVIYAKGPFSLGMRWQHLPELDTAPGAAPTAFGVDAHDQFDLFGSYSFGDRWSVRYGIDNVTDEEPEWTTRTTTNNSIGTTNSYYDQIGRRVFIGMTMTL